MKSCEFSGNSHRESYMGNSAKLAMCDRAKRAQNSRARPSATAAARSLLTSTESGALGYQDPSRNGPDRVRLSPVISEARFRPSHREERMQAYRIERFGSVDGIVLRSSEDPRPRLKET